MKATIKFRPIEDETLKLLRRVHDDEEDPIETYSRLLSATMVAAAIIGITPEQLAEHAPEMLRGARRAVEGRPDIFGGDGGNSINPQH